jgi:hypothetical protein
VRMVTVRSNARSMWLPALAHAGPLSAVPGAFYLSRRETRDERENLSLLCRQLSIFLEERQETRESAQASRLAG